MKRKTIAIFVAGGLILVLAFYSYLWIGFNNKVRKYENIINIGMSETETHARLGPPSPSYSNWNVLETVNIEGKQMKIDTNIFVYKGTLFLRDDIILIFDRKTGKLIHKDRGAILFSNKYRNYAQNLKRNP